MDPSILQTGLKILYYAVVIIITFLSMFSLYIFIRYGENRKLTLTVGIVYIILFLILLTSGTVILNSL